MPDELPSVAGTRDTSAERFFMVGVGASAGGLEPLSDLLRHAPRHGMSFIVVQHLAPDHKSLLAELLGRVSSLEVVTVTDGVRVVPNTVYVLPAGSDLTILHGVLHLLTPAQPHASRLPIDSFFRSLAEDQGAAAIGVVLSGTGTDGTFGLEAIKAAGGFTFVQEPGSAKFDGMPRSALASGAGDRSLTPRQIADELAWVSDRPDLAGAPVGDTSALNKHELAKLYAVLRGELGNDLSQYKPATVERRIERRMALQKLTHLEDYVRFVQSSPAELRALYKDTLIGVTSFFRDAEPFVDLEQRLVELLQRRASPSGAPLTLRGWVPACATGEEAYSVAICMLEALERANRNGTVQIFGTDVDADAVAAARQGLYPSNIALDVSPDRLARFFVERGDGYQVTRRLRDVVVFSQHNLFKDTPFSRMDVVSCRNLLIYLQPTTQSRVLRLLHHALDPQGLLLLGSSESIGDHADLFSLVDQHHRLYTSKKTSGRPVLELDPLALGHPEGPALAAPLRRVPSLPTTVDRKLLELYAPPGVVVDEQLDIVHFRGHTGPFLDPAAGQATLNLLRIARPDLHVELERAAREVLATNTRVTVDVRAALGGVTVRLEVLPLRWPEDGARYLLVLFNALPSPEPAEPGAAPAAGARGAHVEQQLTELELELARTRERLHTALEERQAAEEDFRAASEELQSTNEELQSTNEELETSKEELTTVNDELQHRMVELSEINDDLQNVLSGIDNAVFIIGADLRLRRCTAAARRLVALLPTDLDAAVDVIETFTGPRQLRHKVSVVLRTLGALEEEVLCANQRWYLMRLAPYQTVEHVARGAVLTFIDVDVRKKANMLTHDIGEYASRFLAEVDHPLLVVDGKLRVAWANGGFYARFAAAPEEIIGSALPDIGTRQWLVPELRSRIKAVLDRGAAFRDIPLGTGVFEAHSRPMKLAGTRVPISAESTLALLSFEDA